MIVPAVTDVCRPLHAHSNAGLAPLRARPDAWPQSGQTKPFGRRRSTSYFAHASWSGKRASKSWRDMGRSVLQRGDMVGTLSEHLAAASLHCTRCAEAGRKGIRLAKEVTVVIA